MTINKSSGLFIGLLIGGAIGGAIALLYAPKSGKHFRNDISRKTNELIDEGRKKTYDTLNGAKEKAESTIGKANDFLNSGIERIADKKEKLKGAFKAGLNAYEEETESENDRSGFTTENADNTNSHIT